MFHHITAQKLASYQFDFYILLLVKQQAIIFRTPIFP